MKKRNTKRADGRFVVRVYMGIENGKARYKYAYGATQSEADRKAEEIKAILLKGLDPFASDNFQQWAERWLDIKKAIVSYKTYTMYRNSAAHLINAIGNMDISKIRVGHIQSVISDLAERNPNTGKPTAKHTLEIVRETARGIFDLAIANRVIDYNPVSTVVIPTRAPVERRRALTDEEQRWIVETPHRAQRAAMTMMYSGLRRGELLPLEWEDIDLNKRTINVCKAVEMVHSRPQVKRMTKTKAGMRTVYIPKVLADFLRAEKEKDQPGVHQLVFRNTSGKMLTESAFSSMWDSYLTDLNFKYGKFLDKPKSKFDPRGVPFVIPHITAHWLRHTYATMLYLSGVDVLTAKNQLGHANIQTTLQIYTHLDAVYQRHSIDRLDAYLKTNVGQNVGQEN